MVSNLLLFPDDERAVLVLPPPLLLLLSSLGEDRCGVPEPSGELPNPNRFRMADRSQACCGASDGE